MPLESYVDVLIIGAGPAGLMCANALAMANIDIRIIDKRAIKVAAGQADGIATRTIEILQSYGLAERLMQEGNRNYVAAAYEPGPNGEIECVQRLPSVREPTARYPFSITLNQAGIEAIFLDSLREHGVDVEWSRQPVALEISEDVDELSSSLAYPARVTIEHLDSTEDKRMSETIHAKFVVGTDGAHSWVRKTLGIEMEGEQTDYIWGVVDTRPKTNFPDIRNGCAIRSKNGSCLVIPREGDKNRFYVQLSDTDVIDPLTGKVEKDRTSPQNILSTVRKILHPYVLSNPENIDWWTVYIIGQRVASSYAVKNRIFIAGDACHTHSPKAGQGMNASMGDTHNLAWKLAQVLRGWSKPSLLETYEHERRKYAQDLIKFDKMYATLFSGKAKTADNEDGISRGELAQAFRMHGGFITGIGIQYSPSAIVNPGHQIRAQHLIIGKRMLPQILIRAADMRPIDIHDLLPADVRFKLLLFTGKLTPTRIAALGLLSRQLDQPSSFLRKYDTSGEVSTVFDIITIIAGQKGEVHYMQVPTLFCPHWTKVLLDDTDMTECEGGHAYEAFGIDPEQITLVAVRPDGYVGAIAPSTAIADLESYFDSFMIPHSIDT